MANEGLDLRVEQFEPLATRHGKTVDQEMLRQVGEAYVSLRRSLLPEPTLTPSDDPRHPDNVVGIGIGGEVVNGVETGLPAIHLHLAKPLPAGAVPMSGAFPQSVGGVPVVTFVSGRARLFNAFTDRYETVPCGVSVGNFDLTANGTLGCYLKDVANGILYLLSCGHVIAPGNTPDGGDVFQPGEGSILTVNPVASLRARYVPQNQNVLEMDAAIAEVTVSRVAVDPRFVIGENSFRVILNTQPHDPKVDDLLWKTGVSTGLSEGAVGNVNATFNVGNVQFQNQILVRPTTTRFFAQPGDSGSIAFLSATNQPSAMVIGGTDNFMTAVCTPFSTIIAYFNSLFTGANFQMVGKLLAV